jgi:hypothetical protein
MLQESDVLLPQVSIACEFLGSSVEHEIDSPSAGIVGDVCRGRHVSVSVFLELGSRIVSESSNPLHPKSLQIYFKVGIPQKISRPRLSSGDSVLEIGSLTHKLSNLFFGEESSLFKVFELRNALF